MDDRELNYWADLNVENDLRRYLTFGQFIANPRGHLRAIFEQEFRPLLARQRSVRDRLAAGCRTLEQGCRALEAELDRWEAALASHRRIENGHILDPMKHHRHPR